MLPITNFAIQKFKRKKKTDIFDTKKKKNDINY